MRVAMPLDQGGKALDQRSSCYEEMRVAMPLDEGSISELLHARYLRTDISEQVSVKQLTLESTNLIYA